MGKVKKTHWHMIRDALRHDPGTESHKLAEKQASGKKLSAIELGTLYRLNLQDAAAGNSQAPANLAVGEDPEEQSKADTTQAELKGHSNFDSRRGEDIRKMREIEQELRRLQEEEPEFYRDMMELDAMSPDMPRGEVDWDTLEQLEVKEYLPGKGMTNKLYVTVTIKNEAGISSRGTTALSASGSNRNTPASLFRLAELIAGVKDEGGDLVKYFPNQMINREQLIAKQAAIKKDQTRIRDMRYEYAVEQGNTETVQRMLVERASEAGYYAGSDYRIVHKAPDSKTGVNLANEDQAFGGDGSIYSAAAAHYFGEVVKNAVPINSLVDEAKNVTGTYVMGAYATDAKGCEFVATVTAEQRNGQVSQIGVYDVAHALNGRQKRGTRPDTKSLGIDPITHTSHISVKDFLEVVKDTFQAVLSDNVLQYFNETRYPHGYYTDRVLYSVDDSVQVEDASVEDDGAAEKKTKFDREAYEAAVRQIEEELLADAYAGINAFGAGATVFTEGVNETMDASGIGRQRQENGVRQTDGPPAERFFVDAIRGEKADYGVGVILDTDIFDGVRPRAWGEVLGKYVYENLAGTELIAYDEQGNQESIYIARANDRARKDGAKK